MKIVVLTLSPIFILIGIGTVLSWRGFLDREQIRDLSKLVFWVGLPALIMDKLSRAEVAGGEVLKLTVVFSLATVVVMGVALLFCRRLKLERRDWGTFIQGAFRGNLAFVGLPILVYMLRGQGEERVAEVVALAMFSFAPTMVLYNGVSIWVLEWSRQDGGRQSYGNTARELIRNPLILSVAAGLLIRQLPMEMPAPVRSVLELLGGISIPLALICLGGALVTFQLHGRVRSSVVAAVIKSFALPLIVLGMCAVLPLNEDARMVCLIFSACPTAVASYVMSVRMGGDDALASGIIVCSTLFSVASLSAVVYFLVG